MKTLTDFSATLPNEKPPAGLSVQLQSLWYDARGDWQTAHNLIDQLTDRQSAWVHAYLHRKEGDIWNADYWYSRAKQQRPDLSLDEEWEQLVVACL
jgi:arylamine N-acetyltransferase